VAVEALAGIPNGPDWIGDIVEFHLRQVGLPKSELCRPRPLCPAPGGSVNQGPVSGACPLDRSRCPMLQQLYDWTSQSTRRNFSRALKARPIMPENTAEAPRAVLLLSGGLDSSTTLAIARNEGYDVYALSFRYGQRHAPELDAARKIASSPL
jgi:Queuosine biosynthesis protein QueC